MDKKILMLGLFLTGSVFGMNIDDCNVNYNAQQQTTLAEDVQEGDFCSGLTSYNGELGYYLLRLDDEEGLKHVRKLSLEELIYFNGWKYTLPKTEEEFHRFIKEIENVGPSDAYYRYTTELIFHCVNNEKDLLNEKIKVGIYFASLLSKYPTYHYSELFSCDLNSEYCQLTGEITDNNYDASSILLAELAEGINSVDSIVHPLETTKRVPYPPYYAKK